MNWLVIPLEERKKLMMDHVKSGTCPVCMMPIEKNGKPTHSKTKLKVCESIFRKLTVIEKSGVKLPDGRHVSIDAKLMPKTDAEKLKGFRNV